jgi:hypothetical protein
VRTHLFTDKGNAEKSLGEAFTALSVLGGITYRKNKEQHLGGRRPVKGNSFP